MSKANGVRAYFSCLSCEAVYTATQSAEPNQPVHLQTLQAHGAPMVGKSIQLYELARPALQTSSNCTLTMMASSPPS